MAMHNLLLATGCEALDKMLGGGIKRGEVALVYGEPATGKTSLAIQCAFTCAKKEMKVIFIDSDSTFSSNRLAQIAGDELADVSPLIFVFKPRNFKEQTHLIENLDNYNLNNIALVVVDTITSLYRVELASAEKIFTLNTELNWQLAYMNELAKTHNTSFLLTSQVRSVVKEELGGEKIEPVANRVLKYWAQTIVNLETTSESSVKKATLEKRPNHEESGISCLYIIGMNGIVSANK